MRAVAEIAVAVLTWLSYAALAGLLILWMKGRSDDH